MATLKFSPFVRQSIVTAAVGCNIVCNIGFVFGYPGILLPALHKPDSPIPLNDVADSWIASIISIGLILGNFLASSIMDRFGRKAAHIGVGVPSLLSWFIIALAVNVEMLILARFLQGLSLGLILPLRSVLIGEYSSPKYRGAFLTTISLAQGFGLFIVHLIGSLVHWQLTSVVCGVFTFCGLVMSLYLPESPSWLAAKGRYEDCKKTFLWLRGEQEESELEEMINSRKTSGDAKDRREGDQVNSFKRITKLVKKREFFKPIIIVAHCYMMIQVCGNATMPAFSVVILNVMMGQEANAHAWMVILDTLRIFANIAAVYIINRFKRRTVIFLAGGICTGVHLAIAGYVYAKTNALLAYDAQWIPGSLVIAQFVCIGLGIVPMPTVIAGEVIPLDFRSTISSIGVVVLAVFMFAVLKTFPLLLNSIGLSGTYAIYAGLLGYILVVLAFLLPETSGKTLQEIEREFKDDRLRDNRIEVERVSLKAVQIEDDEAENIRR